MKARTPILICEDSNSRRFSCAVPDELRIAEHEFDAFLDATSEPSGCTLYVLKMSLASRLIPAQKWNLLTRSTEPCTIQVKLDFVLRTTERASLAKASAIARRSRLPFLVEFEGITLTAENVPEGTDSNWNQTMEQELNRFRDSVWFPLKAG